MYPLTSPCMPSTAGRRHPPAFPPCTPTLTTSLVSDLIRSRYNHDSYGATASTTAGDRRYAGKGLTVLGAVNGMRPGARAGKGGVNGFAATAEIDNSCMQSREVWTGTTYALAAGMILEARARAMTAPQPCNNNSAAAASDDRRQQDQPLPPPPLPSSSSKKQTATHANLTASPHHREPPSATQMLLHMAFTTAQGVHDAGWTSFGYWFATPEAWEASGNFRSLGYMRPLAVWAMQHALTTSTRCSTTNHNNMNSGNNDSIKM